tara:strand:- start:535 stop:798 length:264 start_codon:yes stop_codon:yes gene_type:complete
MQILFALATIFAPVLVGSLLHAVFGPLHRRRHQVLSLAATAGGVTSTVTILTVLAGVAGVPMINTLPTLFVGAVVAITLFGVAAAGE